MDIKKTIEEKKEILEKLNRNFETLQKQRDDVGRHIVKLSGYIEALEEIAKNQDKKS